MVGMIFLWLLFAVLVGFYASGKGKSYYLYAVISLLLSPLIGFLIAVFSKDDEEKLIKKGLKQKCENCGELIRPEAKICRYCNYGTQAKVIESYSENQNNSKKYNDKVQSEVKLENVSVADEIKKLSGLKEDGLITEDEFKEAKMKILGSKWN